MTGAPLEVRLNGTVMVAALNGEIDLANADELAAEITASVPNAALGVVVDLSAVTYLDSSGVRLIFELSDRLRRRQQALRVVAPAGAPLRRVLELVDLDKTVPVVETVGQASEQIVTSG